MGGPPAVGGMAVGGFYNPGSSGIAKRGKKVAGPSGPHGQNGVDGRLALQAIALF